METRELTCIGCPMGCALTVKMEEGNVISVSGNTCQQGDIYARKDPCIWWQSVLRCRHPTQTGGS